MKPVDEHDDDAPVGRVLSRREMLKVLAGAGIAVAVTYGTAQAAAALPLARTLTGKASGSSAVAGSAANAVLTATATPFPSCVVRPEETEGPYFIDERLNRSDIRSDADGSNTRPGVLLGLTFAVTQINGGCAPLAGAMVDVWHCDAVGTYSEFGQAGTGHQFLRGYQLTDSNGMAQFTTIYPGWYSGRTVHIHFKIRTDPDGQNGYEFTSQLFFDDNLTDQVFLAQPYVGHGIRNTRNANDGIYQNGGSQLMLDCVADGNVGYISTFPIGLAFASGTPIPTATATALATSTAVATSTPNATNTPGSTATVVSTSTPGATNTPGSTVTPGSTSTAVPTGTATSTPVSTSTAVATNTPGATITPGATDTPSATSTPEECNITFSDVNPGDYFYAPVTYLACMGAISGYPDGTFRPFTNASRGQFVKILVTSQGWSLVNPANPTFSDVLPGSTFYQYIETAVARGIVGGYYDGTFKPNANVTRAQACKMVGIARGWVLVTPQVPTFSDVEPGSTFYSYIETAARLGIVNGYGDGSFGPQNPAARGQISKIIYLARNT